MKIINAYTEGFSSAFSFKKIVMLIYAVTLMMGLIIVGAFNATITGSVGANPEMYKLLNEFDFTIYSDFMNNYGDMIRPFINQIFWFGVFYFFFTVFFAGGVLKCFDGSTIKSKIQAFFAGCAKYFFRFFRLGIYVLVIQLIVFVIVAVIFSAIFNKASDSSAEPSLFTIIVIWFGLHILFFIFISIISDYTKIILVKEDSKKVWRALYGGLKYSLKKIHVTFSLYLLLLIVPVILTFVYFLLNSVIGMSSIPTVLVMFLIQQFFIWSRVFCKVWILGSEYELFNKYLYERTQPLLTQEMLMNESL